VELHTHLWRWHGSGADKDLRTWDAQLNFPPPSTEVCLRPLRFIASHALAIRPSGRGAALPLVVHQPLGIELYAVPQVLGQFDRVVDGQGIPLRLHGLELSEQYAQGEHIEHHQGGHGFEHGKACCRACPSGLGQRCIGLRFHVQLTADTTRMRPVMLMQMLRTTGAAPLP